jgi:hypothetical protein
MASRERRPRAGAHASVLSDARQVSIIKMTSDASRTMQRERGDRQRQAAAVRVHQACAHQDMRTNRGAARGHRFAGLVSQQPHI